MLRVNTRVFKISRIYEQRIQQLCEGVPAGISKTKHTGIHTMEHIDELQPDYEHTLLPMSTL
jgi:hypothetical protein